MLQKGVHETNATILDMAFAISHHWEIYCIEKKRELKDSGSNEDIFTKQVLHNPDFRSPQVQRLKYPPKI